MISTVLGAMGGFLLFGGIFLLAQRHYKVAALGFGDVMLALMVGSMLGLVPALWSYALAMLMAGIVAFALLVSGKATLRTPLPYGLFLSIAALIILFIAI